MQIIIPVGDNNFDWPKVNHALGNIGLRTVSHDNILAKLSSLWQPKLDQENLIRKSGVKCHVNLSFLIGCSKKHMLYVGNYVKVTPFDTEENVLALCTGDLNNWHDTVHKLLFHDSSNSMGKCLLLELEKLGYGGLFAGYNRVQRNGLLMLEDKK